MTELERARLSAVFTVLLSQYKGKLRPGRVTKLQLATITAEYDAKTKQDPWVRLELERYGYR